MIEVSRDAGRNILIIEYKGKVDKRQMEAAATELAKVLPSAKRGFKFLVDLSAVDTMEPDVEPLMKRAMDMIERQGVAEIVRVFPNENMDFGFDIMARSHYSKNVNIRTVRTRAQGDALLAVPPSGAIIF